MRKIFTLFALAFVVNFGFGQIIATDDTYGPVNGALGFVNIDNAFLSNDLLNGVPVTLATITGSVVIGATPFNGGPVPVLDPVTGIVSVPPGTPAGTYTITYEICENANLNNCDQAVIVVNVGAPEIVANDDLYGPVNGTIGSPNVSDILNNDILNGAPADLGDITISLLVPATPNWNGAPTPQLNWANGVVSVPAGTPAGTYTMYYILCENLNPTNCDDATITVVVEGIIVQANPDTLNVSPLGTASINVYDNDLTVNPSDFFINISWSPLYGSAVINQDGTLTYINTTPLGCDGDSLIYQFCENLNPSNCFEAMVYILPEPAAPVIDNCPADIIVNSDAGVCGANVFWNAVTASSSCGNQVTLTQTHSPGDFFPIGSTSVTYAATDLSGNTSVCQFLVTVNDNEAPTCPSNMTLNTSPSTCSALVVLPNAVDNCDVVLLNGFSTVPGGLISGGQWPVGVNEVSYDLTDGMGNTAACNFTVTIIDNISPTFSSCPENISLDSPDGSPVLVSWDEPQVFDNCSYTLTNFAQYPDGTSAPNIGNSNNLFPIGVSVVSYTALDGSGNPATCVFEVEVIDLTTGISGTVYLDENQNCSIDGADVGMSNVLVQLFDDLGAYVAQTMTNANGEYQFFVDAGVYSLSIQAPTNGLTVSCPAGVTQNATVVANQMTSDVDFGMFCPSSGFDISLSSISKEGWVFPGQNHTLSVVTASLYQQIAGSCAGVTSNNDISGELTITLVGPVFYQSVPAGSLTPTSMSGLTFTYNIADYSAISNNSFMLNLGTETSAQSGDLVTVNATFTPSISGDVNPSNNSANFTYQVVNSYDPNIKTVSPIGDVLVGYEDDLIYTIYFQNTGDAPAFNITLVDTLSSNLNLLTFEKMASSHDCSVDIMGNEVIIHFPDIMLPDSTSNPEGSIGFFQYKIKPLVGLEEGASIENTAHIFFDFNEAIVTNTTLTNFVVENESSLIELNFSEMTIFPNPNNGSFSVSFNAGFSGEANLQITDVSGKSHFNERINVDANGFSWQGDLSPGVYFVRIVELSSGEVYFEIGRAHV